MENLQCRTIPELELVFQYNLDVQSIWILPTGLTNLLELVGGHLFLPEPHGLEMRPVVHLRRYADNVLQSECIGCCKLILRSQKSRRAQTGSIKRLDKDIHSRELKRDSKF
jgi:hypothetical protein